MNKIFIFLLLIFGIIKLSNSQYDNIMYYSVATPTKMNVVYVGVGNPMNIIAADIPADKMHVSISSGTISSTGPYNYIVKPNKSANSIIISVSGEIDGVTKSFGSHKFRVKHIPNPTAEIAGMKGGTINKNLLAAQSGIIAALDNFDFDIMFTIVSYTFSYTDSLYVNSIQMNGNKFSQKIIDVIKKSEKGDKLYFEDIKAKGPDGEVRLLGSIRFIIN
ncbi:MAG: GldM family protein [Bacteroidota bacterium]